MVKKKTHSSRLSMPQLPNNPLERQYKKNYLKNVLVQVQFVNPITSAKKSPDSKLVQHILRSFPKAQHKLVSEQHISVNPQDGLTQATNRLTKQYHYVARTKNLEITDEHCTVSYSRYSSFPRLRKDFLPFVDLLFKRYNDIQIKRLGLRYIDNIDLKGAHNPTDWSKYLIPKLLPSFDVPAEGSKIARSFHLLETIHDDIVLRFQYGMHNPDYPAPIKRKIFTLDNDAFVTGELDREAIHDYLDRLHVLTKTSFENAITMEFRRHLGIKA